MSTEAAIAKAIVRYLRDLPDGYARRVWTGGPQAQGGEPDVDAVVDGRAVKLEVKRPETRGKVTPLQAVALDRWSRAGAVVGVVCSVNEVRALLRSFDLVDEAIPYDEQVRVVELCRPPAPTTVIRRGEAVDPEGSTASR